MYFLASINYCKAVQQQICLGIKPFRSIATVFLTGETRNEDRQRNLETDTIMVPFVVAVLANSVFINVQANIAAEARRINMNQYQEVCQKPAHKAMPKKKMNCLRG